MTAAQRGPFQSSQRQSRAAGRSRRSACAGWFGL